MRISVFGLGYVGTINAVCLAQAGHQVYGVDMNLEKVRMVNEGKSPIVEEGVESMLADQVHNGRLHATTFPAEAIAKSEMSIICVGTPSAAHGAIDLSQVEQVCKQIGTVLRDTDSPHTVVIRSTMLPGSTAQMSSILSDCSARPLGFKLHIAFNPEFLREGTAIRDFYCAPYTVVGTDDSVAAANLKEIYHFLAAPLYIIAVAEAELLKYACNAFHATKITFANEIGRVARSWGIDGSKVMEMLCRDNALNISAAYLRPGFAYGGSCLPKDLRALAWKARLTNVRMPLLESLSWSNQLQIDHAYELIARAVKNKRDTLGFLGLAFKPGTDDLRESPIVELVERFIGKGYRLCLYDENISLARLTGTNREFIDQRIPHLMDLMAEDIDQFTTNSKVFVISRPCPHYLDALHGLTREIVALDLERILNGQSLLPPTNKLELTRRSIAGYEPTREFAFDRAAGLDQ
jgi:GDP-mannose 6-dehydrogenase